MKGARILFAIVFMSQSVALYALAPSHQDYSPAFILQCVGNWMCLQINTKKTNEEIWRELVCAHELGDDNPLFQVATPNVRSIIRLENAFIVEVILNGQTTIQKFTYNAEGITQVTEAPREEFKKKFPEIAKDSSFWRTPFDHYTALIEWAEILKIPYLDRDDWLEKIAPPKPLQINIAPPTTQNLTQLAREILEGNSETSLHFKFLYLNGREFVAPREVQIFIEGREINALLAKITNSTDKDSYGALRRFKRIFVDTREFNQLEDLWLLAIQMHHHLPETHTGLYLRRAIHLKFSSQSLADYRAVWDFLKTKQILEEASPALKTLLQDEGESQKLLALYQNDSGNLDNLFRKTIAEFIEFYGTPLNYPLTTLFAEIQKIIEQRAALRNEMEQTSDEATIQEKVDADLMLELKQFRLLGDALYEIEKDPRNHLKDIFFLIEHLVTILRANGFLSYDEYCNGKMLALPYLSPSQIRDVLRTMQVGLSQRAKLLIDHIRAATQDFIQDSEMRESFINKMQRMEFDRRILGRLLDLAQNTLETKLAEAPPESASQPTIPSLPMDITRQPFPTDSAKAGETLFHFGAKARYLRFLADHHFKTAPGFHISGYANLVDPAFDEELKRLVAEVEKQYRQDFEDPRYAFGRPDFPVLLAVRSSPVQSMPGILESILGVGINDAIAEALGKAKGDRWAAYDSYYRFLFKLATLKYGLSRDGMEQTLRTMQEKARARRKIRGKVDLSAEEMKEVVEQIKLKIRAAGHGEDLDAMLANPWLQLRWAIEAVKASYDTAKAVAYRRNEGISPDWKMGILVQSLILGNLRNLDGEGLSFTAAFSTEMGNPEGCSGNMKPSALGPDIMSGTTPGEELYPIGILPDPSVKKQVFSQAAAIQRESCFAQNLEVTAESGNIYWFQTRRSSLRFQGEDSPSAQEVSPDTPPLFRGFSVGSNGIFKGVIVIGKLTNELLKKAEDMNVNGLILVREDADPGVEVEMGSHSLIALVSKCGGPEAHAFQYAMANHRVALGGVSGMRFDPDQTQVTIEGYHEGVESILRDGDILILDGRTGKAYLPGKTLLIAEMQVDEATNKFLSQYNWAHPKSAETAENDLINLKIFHDRLVGNIFPQYSNFLPSDVHILNLAAMRAYFLRKVFDLNPGRFARALLSVHQGEHKPREERFRSDFFKEMPKDFTSQVYLEALNCLWESKDVLAGKFILVTSLDYYLQTWPDFARELVSRMESEKLGFLLRHMAAHHLIIQRAARTEPEMRERLICFFAQYYPEEVQKAREAIELEIQALEKEMDKIRQEDYQQSYEYYGARRKFESKIQQLQEEIIPWFELVQSRARSEPAREVAASI